MKNEWILLMIETKRLRLKVTHLLTHYLIVLFLLIPFFLTLFGFIQKHILHNYSGVKSPDEMLMANLPLLLLAVAFFFIQMNKLKFKIVETNLPEEKLEEIIKETADELEWYYEISNDKIVIAKTHPKWSTGSWGEQITIIFDKSFVMVNSICDPDKKASVVSFGRNKRNMNRLIEKIKAANR